MTGSSCPLDDPHSRGKSPWRGGSVSRLIVTNGPHPDGEGGRFWRWCRHCPERIAKGAPAPSFPTHLRLTDRRPGDVDAITDQDTASAILTTDFGCGKANPTRIVAFTATLSLVK